MKLKTMIMVLSGVMMMSGCAPQYKLNDAPLEVNNKLTLEAYNAGEPFYAAQWHDRHFKGHIDATKATCPNIIEKHKVTEAYVKLYWDLDEEITALAIDGIEGDDLHEINVRKLKRESLRNSIPDQRDFDVSQRAAENCQLMAEGKIPNTESITD